MLVSNYLYKRNAGSAEKMTDEEFNLLCNHDLIKEYQTIIFPDYPPSNEPEETVIYWVGANDDRFGTMEPTEDRRKK